ncbi:ABC transporter ATP-binding protein [Marinobacter bohaiensis]|uniref:ABC transporter ATP-binding protein n=1 Tax=Marinobacter bohaiensis TaxID=2201898 RepID=UPI000DAEDCAE|nr:ABC transporter ATP-binding protein [Marinobacter bohaiensis]
MSFLEIRQLTKRWGDKVAVDDLSLTIDEGEFVALLGPSGCGKSTTLNMIAGLETPSSGEIHLNGQDISALPPGRRNLSMVFQSYALLPHLSVKENILFGLKARRVPRQEQADRLEHALALVDLNDHVHKKPGQLSGGQCQRVALARTIVSKAPLCLMDEPLSNLDAKLRNEMRSEIRALQQKLGLTVVYVTHDQVEAMSMADRILLLNQGQVEQNDRPDALYNQPASRFTAGFIGQPPMNLFERDGVIIGVRPEHIRVVDDGGLMVEVIDEDYHGAESILTVDLHGERLRLTRPGRTHSLRGTRLRIAWPIEDEHRFCPDTGRRLPAAPGITPTPTEPHGETRQCSTSRTA